MCLARDALNGAQVRADRPDIAAQVMAAIGAEAPSGKVVPLVRGRSSVSFWRPAIGLASAATVASIAFFLGYRSPSVPPMVATGKPAASLVATTPVAAVPAARQVAAEAAQARTVAVDTRAIESQEEWDGRSLNPYLMDYSSYRAGTGMADTLGYARFAAHTAEYTPEH